MTKQNNPPTIFVVPHLIMDVVYDKYVKYIKGIGFEHLASKANKSWSENYNKFNRMEFRESGDISSRVDLMDSMEQAINNDLVLMKIELMDAVPEFTFEQKTIFSENYLCKELVELANIAWKARHKMLNCFLSQIHNSCTILNKTFISNFDLNRTVNLNETQLEKKMLTMWDHIVAWADEQDKKKGHTAS